MERLKYPFLDLGIINAGYADALKAAAARVIDSGRYIGGTENEAFEKELADFTGTKYAVGVSNGLDALRLIFKAYIEMGRLEVGDEVIVPANTYIASVLAVTDFGLIPVFVEPEESTLNLDTSKLEAAVTPHTKAILTVHLYGRACYDAIMASVATKYGLLVIEDNAQAIGADSHYPSKKGTTRTGSLGDASAYSFYPTKNLGALGDAGAVTTDDSVLAATVRALANYGCDRRYHNIYQGYNCRLDPVQAAFLRAKLPFVEAENKHRRQVAAVYDEFVKNSQIIKPRRDETDGSVWHQYVIQCDTRDRLASYLADNGVGTDVNYPVPPHLQPCYMGFSNLKLPIAEAMARRVLSIPVSSCTSLSDAREIAEIINAYNV